MTTRLIIGPAVEPVTLAETKLVCRVDDTDSDPMISGLIKAAREQCENVLQRALITQTWEKTLDFFPGDGIELLNPPIISLDSIKYVSNVNGVETTLSSNLYMLDKDSEPGWALPAYGLTWPAALNVANAVHVRFTCGYGPDGSYVPESIKTWIKLAVQVMFDRCCEGETATKLPDDFFFSLISRYKVWGM